MATVKLFGNLRKHIDGTHLQISGGDIRAVVENLCELNPSICEDLLADGEIRPHFKVTLNGHDIFLAEALETIVHEDDQIAIFSPIAGG
jgi:molybdopterin converting factor small subunit